MKMFSFHLTKCGLCLQLPKHVGLEEAYIFRQNVITWYDIPLFWLFLVGYKGEFWGKKYIYI